MKRYLLLVMMIIPFCSSCGTANRSAQSPSSTKPILFLEFVTNVYGNSTGGDGCPELGPLGERIYKYSGNRLRSYTTLDIHNSQVLLGCTKSLNDDVGSGTEGILFAVQELPFTPPAPDYCQGITIQSIDESGRVDFDLNEHEYSFDAGLSTIRIDTDDSIPGCHIMISYRVSNYGFMNEHQIRIPSK